jgi:hypothetical protein
LLRRASGAVSGAEALVQSCNVPQARAAGRGSGGPSSSPVDHPSKTMTGSLPARTSHAAAKNFDTSLLNGGRSKGVFPPSRMLRGTRVERAYRLLAGRFPAA